MRDCAALCASRGQNFWENFGLRRAYLERGEGIDADMGLGLADAIHGFDGATDDLKAATPVAR